MPHHQTTPTCPRPLILALLATLLLQLVLSTPANAADAPIVKGFCIAAPNPDGLPRFLTFVEQALAPAGINLLTLRVDFNYAYETHPELRSPNPLSRDDVRSIVETCRRHGIRVVPQVNLLGHQSWAANLGNLLRVYPQFDETPHVPMPETYSWPNPDGLYCKSYCPLHPDVHTVVFALVDEIMDAFEADAFHAGMDEVFYIADDRCPRCAGQDPAVLFANEVAKIRNHLAAKNRELWIWGDRLLDAQTTGIGMWEAADNGTAPAIDLIPRDVVICDWHYERAEPTAPYFALKGLRVVTCPWNKPPVATAQAEDFLRFRQNANPTLAPRYLGMMQTIWTSNANFLDAYYGEPGANPREQATVESLRAMLRALQP